MTIRTLAPAHTVALLLLAPALVGAQQDAGAVLREASRVYRSLSSLSADFDQVIEDRMIDTLSSRGHLLQAGPAQLRMQFSDPDGDLIVSDGTHVWFYLPSTTPGQVIRTEVPSDPVYGPNLLARILDRPEERYDSRSLGSESIGGRTAHVVELIPRSDDPPFRRAKVWFDQADALPRRIELDEASGQRRILVLTRLRPNVSVPRDAFRFVPPSGVRIVDQ